MKIKNKNLCSFCLNDHNNEWSYITTDSKNAKMGFHRIRTVIVIVSLYIKLHFFKIENVFKSVKFSSSFNNTKVKYFHGDTQCAENYIIISRSPDKFVNYHLLDD